MHQSKIIAGELNILEIGAWIPEDKITSSSIQRDIDRCPELRYFNLTEKAGVIERRIAAHDVTILDMAEYASLDAIARAADIMDFSVSDIDTIIYSSVFRMYSEPATATLLQKRLGIPSAVSFDVSNACLSFLDGLIIADSFIKSGISRCALVVSAEKVSTVLKNSRNAIMENEGGSEYLASLTLGDGAAAAIVCTDDFSVCSRLKLKGFSRTTLSDYADCCILPSQEHPMKTDSGRLFNGALMHYPRMFHKLVDDIGWKIDDIDVIVPHQASLKIIRRAMEAIDFPMEKCAVTVDLYGNMASVSIPFTLKQSIEERKLSKGNRVGILGFGSGLSFSMMAFEVNYPADSRNEYINRARPGVRTAGVL